jgi:hypothetical protein
VIYIVTATAAVKLPFAAHQDQQRWPSVRLLDDGHCTCQIREAPRGCAARHRVDHFLDDERGRTIGYQHRRIDCDVGWNMVHPQIASGEKPALHRDHAVDRLVIHMICLVIDSHLNSGFVASVFACAIIFWSCP